MRNVLTRIPEALRSVAILRRAGMISISHVAENLRSLRLLKQLGPIASATRVAAQRDARAVGLVDERGALTFEQLDRRSNALARALADRGLGPDSVLAVLCRDHRGLVDTMLAAGKLGARLVLLNTGFAKPQLAAILVREGVDALVYDQEFADLFDELDPATPRFLACADPARPIDGEFTVDDLIEGVDDRPTAPPATPGGLVLLTSGTTGAPKGAPRQISSALSAAEFLDRVPMRRDECTVLAAPLFHGTGLSQFILSFGLGCRVVLRRRFDAAATLRAVRDNRATELVLVPTMLRRILDLGVDVIKSYDTSSLRIIFCAGSALPPELAKRAIAVFGDVLYNMYGSTEVAVATIATPEDLRTAPGTVGKAPCGCRVALYDDHGIEITKPGVVGRVFVGSDLVFGGYTDGRTKEIIDGLLCTGDVGHVDHEGRLFIDGRDDEMIVSGGENVYPAEVENLLVEHDGVVEAAVIGVPDEEFGQRLKAYVVPRAGVTVTVDALKLHVKANLARYKVPREVVFLDELPRGATGKVVRGELS